jgi:aminoglycoside phosphotransferase (APT) family kinase protein
MLLAFDTFSSIPKHAEALDVGAIQASGDGLISLREFGEFYLLTRFVPGHPYASELRALSDRGAKSDRDVRHCAALAQYLAELHRKRPDAPGIYRRSVRDLVGSGEGIMGIIDGYPDSLSPTLHKRLQKIEAQCQEWRWKLRDTEDRLVRIHGDIHPFNIVFDDDELHVLDASRGCMGDAADDLACLAINYLFFGSLCQGRARGDFRRLFRQLFEIYFAKRPDERMFDTIAPYFAWRGLVLANPAWYPKVESRDREHLLSFIESCLSSCRFELEMGEEFLS